MKLKKNYKVKIVLDGGLSPYDFRYLVKVARYNYLQWFFAPFVFSEDFICWEELRFKTAADAENYVTENLQTQEDFLAWEAKNRALADTYLPEYKSKLVV